MPLPPFDIFQIEGRGEVFWVAAADSLQEARMRAQEHSMGSSKCYIILDNAAGRHLLMDTVAVNGAGPDSPAAGWETVCRDLAAEEDLQALMEKISAAEMAILERLRRLQELPDADVQRAGIQKALDGLLAIKQRKLNFPGWKRPDGAA